MPNLEFIAAWVAALESGEYEQGMHALMHEAVAADSPLAREGVKPCYCCLGVLCDLHRKLTGGPPWENLKYAARYLGHVGGLPWQVCAWLGIELTEGHETMATPGKYREISDGHTMGGDILLTTAHMGNRWTSDLNDDHGFNFKQIAQCVRRTYGLPIENEIEEPGRENPAEGMVHGE